MGRGAKERGQLLHGDNMVVVSVTNSSAASSPPVFVFSLLRWMVLKVAVECCVKIEAYAWDRECGSGFSLPVSVGLLWGAAPEADQHLFPFLGHLWTLV